MGSTLTSAMALYYRPEITPDPEKESEFEDDYGFTFTRKEREMIATDEEMESAKIPLEARDYCAHLLLDYLSCRADVWPFAVRCKHEKHAYLTCQHEDYILRMKEYERCRRLMVRELFTKK